MDLTPIRAKATALIKSQVIASPAESIYYSCFTLESQLVAIFLKILSTRSRLAEQ